MSKFFKNLGDKFYEKANYILTELKGGYLLLVFALVAIAFAMIGFYGTHGFDWKWNVFFLFPLYIFCAWALWKAFKMYKNTLDDIEKRKKQDEQV